MWLTLRQKNDYEKGGSGLIQDETDNLYKRKTIFLLYLEAPRFMQSDCHPVSLDFTTFGHMVY